MQISVITACQSMAVQEYNNGIKGKRSRCACVGACARPLPLPCVLMTGNERLKASCVLPKFQNKLK